MKLTLRLTLDGLMRALRAKAHREADRIESGRASPRPGAVSPAPPTRGEPRDRRVNGRGRSDD